MVWITTRTCRTVVLGLWYDRAMELEAQLLERFVPGRLEPRFGETLLASYGKHSADLAGEDWSAYALEADVKLNGSHYGQRFARRYFDTTFNFCLTHDGDLVASLGFEIDELAMNVWQIQGVKGAGRWLGPIKWTLALLDYAVSWAHKNGLTKVFVASVDHNDWAAQHAHLDPTRGKLVYDVTAKRCGFRADGGGYYVLALGEEGVC